MWGNIQSIVEMGCAQSREMERFHRRDWNSEVFPNSLQACINDFTLSLGSKCHTCDTNLLQKSRFVQTPPLLAFDLSNNFDSQYLDPELNIIGVQYFLRGVVYFANQHFTEHIITGSGMVWYHDGMFTSHSLVYISDNCATVTSHGTTMAIYAQ